MRNFIFMILLLLFAGAANSQIYKWVDQNGKTQYTDQPPPPGISKNEKMMEIQSSPHITNEEESIAKDLVAKEQALKESRAVREEAKHRQLAEAEMKRENCHRAQSNLELLKNSERLSVPDGNGGIIDVDDQLRHQYRDDALKNIASYC